MTASTRTAQGTGIRGLGAALAAAAVGLALVAGMAIGSLVIAQPQVVAPAAPIVAPATTFDRGWSTDSSNVELAPRIGGGGASSVDELRTRDQAVKPAPVTHGAGGGAGLNRFAR